jgi:phospholipase C
MANQLNKIQHIVQLMLENRSFDQMLGFLYHDAGNKSPKGNPFDGLTGEEWNPDDTGRQIKVFKIKPSDPHPYLMPGADPGEGFHNTSYQLYSTDDPAPGAKATNKGFVINFKSAIASDRAKGYEDTLPDASPTAVMGMYPPEMLPIMSGLARGYAVCDGWCSSAPTQTIPNLAFAAAGTSQGHFDNHIKVFTCPSIFGRLTDARQDWAVYGYNRDPLTRLDFSDTQHADDSHYGHFRDFQARAAAGRLPAYTFLEPSFGSTGNSQHPNYNVAAGEQLIRDVYYALRQDKAAWASTLLIVSYDEHGGNYDHVPPPTDVVPPGDGTVGEWGFDFTRLGVRVPALLISPLIEPGTVYRASSGNIDHTSVLETNSERWKTKLLTKRDAKAASLGDALTLRTARTDDPIAGIQAPLSTAIHPDLSKPTPIDMLHADRVSKLPLRNDHGFFDEEPPNLPETSDGVGNFIRDRTAAWSQHMQRRAQRRGRRRR